MPRILIADDEESMRLLVARAIAMDGHEIVTAEDGAEALEILTRDNGAFDLLLTHDDRLRRSARARLGAGCHRPRCHHQAICRG